LTERFSDFFLEDADPQSIRNYIRKLKGNVVQQSLSFMDIDIIQILPPAVTGLVAGYDPQCVVITDENGKVTTDPELEYIQEVLSTGTAAGTSATGIEITDLTVGQWYAVEGAGGPFHMHPTLPPYNGDFYNFELSTDGITFSGDIGYNNYYGVVRLVLPSFCVYAEAIDGSYGRVYFQATTTSVWFRCTDAVFDDNSGTLGYKLVDGTIGEKRITLRDVEYVRTKLGGAIYAATAKTTPNDNDKWAIWDSATNLLKNVTWSNIKAALKTYFDTLYAAVSHAHAASSITNTPAGNIAATNVQSAINELDSEKSPTGHTHEVDQRADMFSDAEGNPADVTEGGAADGTSTYAARRDHVHHSPFSEGQYRLYLNVDDGAGGFDWVTSGGRPVAGLYELE
jgi:hypothetical protein